MDKDETYSLIIKALVNERGMTLEQIAKEGNFSLQSMYNWENGDHLPHPEKREKLKEIAKAHNVNNILSTLDLTVLSAEARQIITTLYHYLVKESQLEKASESGKKKEDSNLS